MLTPIAQIATPSKVYYHILPTGRMTWQESFNYAIAHNSRLATLAEAKEIHKQNLGNALMIGDIWVPIGDQEANKDWVQIGDGNAAS